MRYWLVSDAWDGRYLAIVVRAETEEQALELARAWYTDGTANTELEAQAVELITEGA